MGAKIFSNPNMAINTDSAFSTEGISQLLQGMAANKRADAQLLMQQAKHDYQMKTIEKTENSANAINEWSSKGLDYEGLTSNPEEAFSKPLTPLMQNWQGYKDAMSSYGITASEETFVTAAQGSRTRFMNQVVSQFNALESRIRAKYPHADDKQINKVLQENYNADIVYANMVKSGMSTETMNYDPTQVRQDWGPWLKSLIWESPIEGVGGGFQAGKPAAVIGGLGAAKAGWQWWGGKKDYLEAAKRCGVERKMLRSLKRNMACQRQRLLALLVKMQPLKAQKIY